MLHYCIRLASYADTIFGCLAAFFTSFALCGGGKFLVQWSLFVVE